MPTQEQLGQLKTGVLSLIQPTATAAKLGLKDRIHPVKLKCPLEWGVKKDEKNVIRIEMIVAFGPGELQFNIQYFEKTSIILTFEDHEKQVFSMTLSQANFLEDRNHFYQFYTLLVAMGGILETAFCKYENELLPWKTTGWCIYRDLNLTDVADFYRNSHQQISQALLSRIQDDEQLEQQANKGIEIYALGCGYGDEIEVILDKLPHTYPVKKILGVDINPRNIAHCKTKFALNNQASFITGDIKNVDSYFSIQKTEHLRIALYSGVLTTSVMENSLVVCQILQKTLRAQAICAISGYENPLVSAWIAKAIGFNTQALTAHIKKDVFTPSNTKILYILKPMSLVERSRYLLKRSKKRSDPNQLTLLDLSISARPLGDLCACLKSLNCTEIETIDLSWAMITPGEIKILQQALEQLSKLSRIILHKSQMDLPQNFEQKYDITLREDGWHDNALPSLPMHKNIALFKVK